MTIQTITADFAAAVVYEIKYLQGPRAFRKTKVDDKAFIRIILPFFLIARIEKVANGFSQVAFNFLKKIRDNIMRHRRLRFSNTERNRKMVLRQVCRVTCAASTTILGLSTNVVKIKFPKQGEVYSKKDGMNEPLVVAICLEGSILIHSLLTGIAPQGPTASIFKATHLFGHAWTHIVKHDDPGFLTHMTGTVQLEQPSRSRATNKKILANQVVAVLKSGRLHFAMELHELLNSRFDGPCFSDGICMFLLAIKRGAGDFIDAL